MSLSLTLLKVVVPALAKTLIDNLGIGDTLTNKALEQVIDVAADDVFQAKEGIALSQQIQQLATRLEKDMQPFFEQEARHLESGSRAAIFLAVAETLLRGSVSLDGLMNVALDAERLKAQLLKAQLLKADVRATVGFSEQEKALYDRALSYASASLIEVVPQLKGFQLSVTQAMLRQTEELVIWVRSQKEVALQQRDQFLGLYRRMLATELDKPDKFGVPLLRNLLSQQRLCEAYVQLSIAAEDEEDPLIRAGEEWQEVFKKRSKNVEEALSTRKRLVIRGGAGAGKTSLMHWLAVHAASQNFEAPLQHWNSLIPFFIRLRNWVDDGFPVAKDFVLPIAKNIVDEMPVGWVREQLDRGCALVLIDGVDELPRVKRQGFFEDLQKLVEEFPRAIYITTSRPAGLKDENGEEWTEWESWVKGEGFSNCVMEPMTVPEIEQFVGRWHRSLPPSAVEDKDPQSLAKDLMRQLRLRSEIRQLAATPLLCTMICALHYVNEGTLPSTRIELYEKCIEMLLESRDKQRKVEESIALTLRQKEGFLMEFAHWLMRNNYSDADVAQAQKPLDECLSKYHLLGVNGQQILQLLLERSGLLREPMMGRIDFVHRTFQEYLAAKALLDKGDLGMLLQRAADDQWRETVIIAVGIDKASESQRQELLAGLIKQGDKNDEKQHYLHFLAVACLETGASIEPNLRTEIETRAKALLPPNDRDEVAMVVRAGEAIVPLLAYDPKFSAREAGLCIEALVQIGSQTAMQQLVAYAKARFDRENDEFEPVGWALGRGYDAFNEQYIQQVLIHVEYLQLNATQIQDLSPLATLTQLRSLDLSVTQIQDLSPLTQLTQLQNLDLRETQVQDLSSLAQLTQLQNLDLDSTQIQDLSPLAQLTQLQNLDLSRTQIQDLSLLAQLNQLRDLSLNDTQIQDLSPLAQLTQLQTLSLINTQVQDFSPLAQLTQLQFLDLDSTQIQELSPLAQLTQLQSLDLRNTQIQELLLLSQLTQLQSLSLGAAQIQDLSPLATFTQLESLNLGATQIQDLSLLATLTQLESLHLNATQVQDLSLLATLTQLRYLSLQGSQIQDLSPLAQLTQLRFLDLHAAQVQDLSPLAKLTQPVQLYLTQSQSEVAAPLKAMKNFWVVFR